MNPATIWPALRRLRERRGLSLRAAAAVAQINPSRLSVIERGGAPDTSLRVVLIVLDAIGSTLCALQREAGAER